MSCRNGLSGGGSEGVPVEPSIVSEARRIADSHLNSIESEAKEKIIRNLNLCTAFNSTFTVSPSPSSAQRQHRRRRRRRRHHQHGRAVADDDYIKSSLNRIPYLTSDSACIPLKFIDKLPAYQAWIPTRVDHFVAHEDIDPFVPYFGETKKARRKAQRVYREMREDCSNSFADGIDDEVSDGELRACGNRFKRSKDDCFDYLHNRRQRQIDRYTIQNIVRRYGTDNFVWKSLSYALGKGSDLHRVQTIHRIANARDKRIRDYQQRREKTLLHENNIRRAIDNPQSDDDVNELSRHPSDNGSDDDDDDDECNTYDAARSSLRYFCFSCHIFACEYHADFNVKPVVPIPDRNRDIRLEHMKHGSAEPCGPNCFLAPINLIDDETENMDDAWRPSEHILFREARSIFGDDWCSIAVTVGTKTCEQVHRHHLHLNMSTEQSAYEGQPSKQTNNSYLISKHTNINHHHTNTFHESNNHINRNGKLNGTGSVRNQLKQSLGKGVFPNNDIGLDNGSSTVPRKNSRVKGIIDADADTEIDADSSLLGMPRRKKGKGKGKGREREKNMNGDTEQRRVNLVDNHQEWEEDEATEGTKQRFIPCSHDGPCTKRNCRCMRKDIRCESTCGCNNGRYGVVGNGIGWIGETSKRCKNRHIGCSCRSGNCTTESCDCFSVERACSPDTCACGCAWLPSDCPLPPSRRCGNIDLVRGMHKKVFIGRSSVHGYGLFTGQHFRAGDLLGAYCGRVMDSDLVDRVLRRSQAERFTYAFDMTNEFTVDAGLIGSKVKFINHADKKEKINCIARIERVRGECRICIKAKDRIRPGQELLMDYKIVHEEGNSWLKQNDNDEDDDGNDDEFDVTSSESE